MKTNGKPGESRAAIGGLPLDAIVVLASSTLSAGDVERARRDGNLRIGAPGNGAAYLEVGGVTVAEGRMKKRRGGTAFVVTRMFGEGQEVPA